jgi:ribosomal-protein-alanine N-acetyltransferase
MPEPRDAARVLAYFERNRTHLEGWEPDRPAAFYTEPFWQRQLEVNREEFRADRGMRTFFVARDAPAGPILGVANLSNLVRGVFQNAFLGYSIDRAHEGRGLMTEALATLLAYAFGDLGLHRVSANYQPHNERSAAVLERLGFVREGFAERYLFLDGAWRDHVLTARTADRDTL